MRALDLLGIPFPRAVHLRGQMPRVRTPMIGIKAGETKGFQQRFAPQENLVLTTPKHLRQDDTRVVIDGMPEPAWIAFVADKRPHLLHLGCAGLLKVHGNLLRVQRAQQRRVHTDASTTACFLSSLSTVSVLIRSTRAVSRIPLVLRLMSIMVCCTAGKHPRLR